MAFNGKYEIESEKNYDEFMKRLGEWGPKYTFPGLVCKNQHWSGTSFSHSFTSSSVEYFSVSGCWATTNHEDSDFKTLKEYKYIQFIERKLEAQRSCY